MVSDPFLALSGLRVVVFVFFVATVAIVVGKEIVDFFLLVLLLLVVDALTTTLGIRSLSSLSSLRFRNRTTGPFRGVEQKREELLLGRGGTRRRSPLP